MENDANGNIDQGQSTTDQVVESLNGTVDGQQGDTLTSGHPAWQEIFDVLPSEFVPLITPKLEAWDKGVQTKIQNVHSQYDQWKPFIENEVDPEAVNMALGLAAAIEEDPERVYRALAEAYGYGQSEQGVADDTGEDDEELDPVQTRIQELEGMMEQLASTFLQDKEITEQAEYSSALDDYMEALHSTYGDFDDQYVYTALANGGDGEQAVKSYNEQIERAIASRQAASSTPQAPTVLGSGGGMPSNRVDPRNLSEADTRALIIQQLENANKET